MKKDKFSLLFLFLCFCSNLVFLMALSKEVGNAGNAGKEETGGIPIFSSFWTLASKRKTKKENATKQNSIMQWETG